MSDCHRPPHLADRAADGRMLTADERERYEERAAIAEYEGHLPRVQAERLAAMDLTRPLAGEREEDRPGDDVIELAHGVPDDRAASLARLLAQARRLRRLGRSRACIRLAVLALNATLSPPVPCFSPGGLCDSLNALLANESGGCA